MNAHKIPDKIRVRYARHESGLFCAVSDDLDGLMVFGPSVEDVQDDLPAVAAAIIKERYGEDVTYDWPEGGSQPGFVPIDCLAREYAAA